MIRRLRTFTLWTSTLLSLLIAAAFVASAWWLIAVQAGGAGVDIASGSLGVGLDEASTPGPAGRHPWGLSEWNYWRRGPRSISVPLYALFLAVAIPTLLVWRFWPKPSKPGHCRCGYDLRGNESGMCPECGVEVQA